MDEEFMPVDEREELASKGEFVLDVIGKCSYRPCPLTSNMFLEVHSLSQMSNGDITGKFCKTNLRQDTTISFYSAKMPKCNM